MPVRLKDVCPRCYAEKGFSIVLEEEKGVYMCPKDAGHKFKKNKEGFLEFIKW